MPRQVDQEARRQRIADAVCRLADEGGLEGVTLRDVAARADVSMGAVQRCFRTKEEMLVFALGHVGARVLGRARARLAESPAQSARSAVGHAVTEMALLRREQHAEARVWLAFVAQAAVSPPLAGVLRANYEALEGLVTGLIAEAFDAGGAAEGARGAYAAGSAGSAGSTDSSGATGAARPTGSAGSAGSAGAAGTVDPRRAALILLALADGLTAQVLVGHLTPEDALGLLDGHLRGLWGEAGGTRG